MLPATGRGCVAQPEMLPPAQSRSEAVIWESTHLSRLRTFRLAQGLNQSADRRVLGTIAMDGIAVAIWTRALADDLGDWVEALPEDCLPQLNALVTVNNVDAAVHAACELSGMPASSLRDALCQDIAALAEAFSAIVEQSLLRVRLDVVRPGQNMKFQMPQGRARLVCSYRGLETEFGAAEVNGVPKQSHTIPLGMPAVFRGLLWDGVELSRVVHCSPLRQPLTVGLLLTIDAAGTERRFSS